MTAEKSQRDLDSIGRQLDTLLGKGIVCPYCENAMPCGPETKTRSEMFGTLAMGEEAIFEILIQCDNEGDEQGEGACPSVDTNESVLLRVELDEKTGEISVKTFRQEQLLQELQEGRKQQETIARLTAERETIEGQVQRRIADLTASHESVMRSAVGTMEQAAKFRTDFIATVRQILDMCDPTVGIMGEDEQAEALEKLRRMGREAKTAENRASHVLQLGREIEGWKGLIHEITDALELPLMKNGRLTDEEKLGIFRRIRNLMIERGILKDIYESVGWTLEDLRDMAAEEARKRGAPLTIADQDPEWTGDIAGPHELTQPHAIATRRPIEGSKLDLHEILERAVASVFQWIDQASTALAGLRKPKKPTKPE